MTPEEKRDLEELKAWKKQVEDELPEKERVKVRAFMEKWQIRFSAAAIVLAIFGLGTPAGVSVLFGWINKQAATQKADVEKAAKNAFEEAKEEIQKSLTSENLRHDVASKLNEQLRGELDRDFKQAYSIHLSGMLVGVKMHVEALNLRSTQTPTVMVDPKILREVIYSLSDLEQAYGDLIVSERTPPTTRAALMYTISGLYDRARGFEERGREWFLEASRVDPLFPEAHMLLGQAHFQETFYLGNGKWSNESGRKKASDYFGTAKKLFKARIDTAARLAKSYEAMVAVTLQKSGNVKREAQRIIDEQIGVQKSMGKPDPRFYLLRGVVYLSAYQDEPHAEKDRKEAASSFLSAFTQDTEFIRALNNYLWICTHDWKDEITVPLVADSNPEKKKDSKTGSQKNSRADGKDKSEADEHDDALLRDRIRVLEQHPLAQEDPALLDTVAEVYAALCKQNPSSEKLEEDIEKARRLIQKALTTARLVNSPFLDTIRKSYGTVQKLCDEAPRKK